MNSGTSSSPNVYLLEKGIDRLGPFLPLLKELGESGPFLFPAVTLLNLLEVPRIIDDQRPVHRNRQGFSTLVELPPVHAGRSMPEVDASMAERRLLKTLPLA